MTGSWDGLVAVCATTYWSGTRLLDQHIATALTEYAPVLYVDPPTSALTRFRNRQAASAAGVGGLTIEQPRLAVLRPRVAPLKERPIGKQLALATVRHKMRQAVRDLGATQVNAVIVPSLNPLFGALDERIKVFYAKDDYLAGAELMGIRRQRLERWARAQPQSADVVIAASPVLADGFRALGCDPVLVPNGCDPTLFALAGESEPPRAIGFVGHLSDRIDLDLLEAVAGLGYPLRLIGPRQETMHNSARMRRILRRPNVVASGAVSYADLPAELAGVTTCVLPYADSAFNRASFPLKVLEYLAAGRRVVATGLPAVQWLDTRWVTVADTPREFAEAVRTSLVTPLGTNEIRARRAFCADHTWSARTRAIAGALGLCEPADARRTETGTLR